MRRHHVLFLILFTLSLFPVAYSQTAQVGAERSTNSRNKLELQYLHYRPGKWEQEKVKEYESENPYEGGMITLYLKNMSDKAISPTFWRVNGKDGVYWRLNYYTLWERLSDGTIEPGETAVLEINGRTDDFAEGREFNFSYMDQNWRTAVHFESTLDVDPVQIAYLHVAEDLKEVTAHIRYSGIKPIQFTSFEIDGQASAPVEWATKNLLESGNTIARIKLDSPLPLGHNFYARLGVKIAGKFERTLVSHRRAHPDFFPIGLWNDDKERWEYYHKHHLDTMVHNGSSLSSFYSEAVPKYGFHAMSHISLPRDFERLNDLKGNPGIVAWMIDDEPDYKLPPNILLYQEQGLRDFAHEKPTFITLCRNTQFPAYANIADIPCQDHYSVTAPSSSIWPHPYGTRLEETGFYTRDLKYATEPKPIWVWTQGIANWGQRPKRPVPTPNELAVQLLQNLGRGTKGILWFNWDTDMNEKYPDAMAAIQGWNRVLSMARGDLLKGDVLSVDAHAPEQVDVAAVANFDTLILFLTNMDYEINDTAYPFQMVKNLMLDIKAPTWIKAASVLHLDPQNGISALPFSQENGRLGIDVGELEAAKIVVISNKADAAALFTKSFNDLKSIE